MHMKTKWLKRLTAAALSIGMAFAPAVAGSGLTYADVKAPERDGRMECILMATSVFQE